MSLIVFVFKGSLKQKSYNKYEKTHFLVILTTVKEETFDYFQIVRRLRAGKNRSIISFFSFFVRLFIVRLFIGEL